MLSSSTVSTFISACGARISCEPQTKRGHFCVWHKSSSSRSLIIRAPTIIGGTSGVRARRSPDSHASMYICSEHLKSRAAVVDKKKKKKKHPVYHICESPNFQELSFLSNREHSESTQKKKKKRKARSFLRTPATGGWGMGMHPFMAVHCRASTAEELKGRRQRTDGKRCFQSPRELMALAAAEWRNHTQLLCDHGGGGWGRGWGGGGGWQCRPQLRA